MKFYYFATAERVKRFLLSQMPDRVGHAHLMVGQIGGQRVGVRLPVSLRFVRRQTAGDEEHVQVFLNAAQNIRANPVTDGVITRIWWSIGLRGEPSAG